MVTFFFFRMAHRLHLLHGTAQVVTEILRRDYGGKNEVHTINANRIPGMNRIANHSGGGGNIIGNASVHVDVHQDGKLLARMSSY